MSGRYCIQSLRKEHEKLLHLVGGIEKMLELASKNVFSEHLKSLKGLQSLEPGLASVEKHCHAEERTIERTFQHSLQDDERARIDAEHEQIIAAVTNLREELKSATADRTMAMILPGMDVVKRLRAHIAYEREMLGRIVPLSNSQKAATRKKKKGKRTLGTKSKRTRKRKIRIKPTYVPYTLETHPEL
jgi:hypothetical protein